MTKASAWSADDVRKFNSTKSSHR